MPDLTLRLARHRALSSALAGLDDEALRAYLASAATHASSIGGTTGVIELDGTPVFVKRVALTDRERRSPDSTANLFELPLFYQYGVGSAGFGAQRELEAHRLTTAWVIEGRHAGFPLLHHARVLDDVGARGASRDREPMVAFWDGSEAVRDRLQAIEDATASLVLFLEHLPHELRPWLDARADSGVEATCSFVARDLLGIAACLREGGLLHFDAHFGNILTDGTRLYLTDFGLATSPRFMLSGAEARFAEAHVLHDQSYMVRALVNRLVYPGATAETRDARDAAVQAWASGRPVHALPPAASVLVERYAPVAMLMNELYRALHLESRRAVYPAEALSRAWASAT